MHEGPSEPLVDSIAMLCIALAVGLLAFKDWFFRRHRRPGSGGLAPNPGARSGESET